MTHLLLLCCAGTAAARTGAFAAPGDLLDASGRARAAALRLPGPAPDRVFASPVAAARETADLMGLGTVAETRLADIGHGAWTGRLFTEVHLADPDAFARWLAAPEAGTPGGETFATLAGRVGAWLGEQAAAGGTVLGVTHPMVLRAALHAAIGLAPAVAMRIDLPPLGLVRLSFNRGWRLQSLTPA
ncbi:histidine phosphatase family protein [Sphingomonas solaris]|uniref:histidine phosphatase family protein n=1 Tax=Alterirhizorhabdus solaris TaxID=2529389 RepID=UPI001396CA7C|nr:histidine phosphatase family protein [Sphingomonas solaris]